MVCFDGEENVTLREFEGMQCAQAFFDFSHSEQIGTRRKCTYH